MKPIRMAALRWWYDEIEGLDTEAISHDSIHITENTPTTCTYKRGQQILCQWTISHDIGINNFFRSRLINFLTTAQSNKFSIQLNYSKQPFLNFTIIQHNLTMGLIVLPYTKIRHWFATNSACQTTNWLIIHISVIDQ